ncbi:UMP kinase [archaeon]|jgi:uridylate kinase|nr:UMP kinase [archaeon]MBT4241966.1 UMP kinase [archaeon]MBT4418513.1 UMP kinase [archaeon]
MKKTIVLSLGGSLIIPNKIDIEFLEKFKKTILKLTKKYKFVIICGGGNTARNYIKGIERANVQSKMYFQSLLGISSTRLNARFMTYFFGKDASKGIPHDMKTVEKSLKRNNIIFCGALRYSPNQTSDTTSAKLANHLNTDFINLTNVKGLYDKNPKKFRSAKFIPEISHKDFSKIANKLKFTPGQHFVLDQKAAKLIKKYNITTYILGQDLKNLINLLEDKHFIGTRIED